MKTGLMGITEPYELEIDSYELDEYEMLDYTCPHIIDGVIPRVVIAYNEAQHNSTGVCLDCLLEYVEQHRGELWHD